MSLNSDVMNDIDQNGVIDNDIIKAPSPIEGNKQKINIISKTQDVDSSVTAMSESELSKLPNLDISFQLVKDNASKIVEFENVEASILAQESISRLEASTVDDVFKNLLNLNIKLEEFTTKPSKTNYNYTLNFMKYKIANEQHNMVSNFKIFFEEPINNASEILNKINKEYLDVCYSLFKDIYNANKGCLESVFNNKNNVIIYNNKFTDITTVSLKQLDVSKIDMELDNKEELSKAVENIKTLFKDNIFNSFILGSLDGKSALDSLDYQSILQYSVVEVDGRMLFKIFNTSTIIDNIQQLKDIVQNNINRIIELRENFNYSLDDYSKVNSFLIKNNLEIQTLINSIKNISSLVFGINNLCLNVNVVFDFYKKL
jgi:hypothetical protein